MCNIENNNINASTWINHQSIFKQRIDKNSKTNKTIKKWLTSKVNIIIPLGTVYQRHNFLSITSIEENKKNIKINTKKLLLILYEISRKKIINWMKICTIYTKEKFIYTNKQNQIEKETK